MNNKSQFYPWIIALMAIALLVGSYLPGYTPVSGAPAAVPTPITQAPFNPSPRIAEFFAPGGTITADTRACANSAGYSTLDLHYIIDQTTVNTVTLTIEYSLIRSGYTDALLYPDGVAIVAANAADAADMKQFHVFGDRTCINADVTNSNSLGIAGVGEFK